MKFPLVYKSEANADIAEIYDYYENQREGLGEDFLAELTAVKNRVASLPRVNRILWGSTRRALFGRFPYGYFYRVMTDRIEVIAIYHHSRDPSGWKSRV